MENIKKYNKYINDEGIKKEMVKLYKLDSELFSEYIKKLIDSNNINEIDKFIKFFEDKNISISSNQFLWQQKYRIEHEKDKTFDVKDVDIDYDEVLEKIKIYNNQLEVIEKLKDENK